MALTLLPSDNANGTGGTAKLAGTGGGAVTVRGRLFEDTYATRTWDVVGSRIGDGTAALALSPGFWWLYAQAGATLSAPLALRVTDTPVALQTRCREAVAAALRLAVPDEFKLRVLVQFRWMSPAPALPAVVLTADGLGETIDTDLSRADLIGVPVLVTAAVSDPAANAFALPAVDALRLSVIDLFHKRRLAGVPECRDCTVEAVALDPDDPRTRGVTTGQLVRVFCRRERPGGIT